MISIKILEFPEFSEKPLAGIICGFISGLQPHKKLKLMGVVEDHHLTSISAVKIDFPVCHLKQQHRAKESSVELRNPPQTTAVANYGVCIQLLCNGSDPGATTKRTCASIFRLLYQALQFRVFLAALKQGDVSNAGIVFYLSVQGVIPQIGNVFQNRFLRRRP